MSACGVSAPPPTAPIVAGQQVAPVPVQTGLARANYYRAMVGLPPLVYLPSGDAGDFKHARYVVKNGIRDVDFNDTAGVFTATGLRLGASHEVAGNPWFSVDGAVIAYNSWTVAASKVPDNFAPMVDDAMASPFSALVILNPQASSISYGQFCEAGRCAATISGKQGIDLSVYEQLYESGADVRQWNRAMGPLPFTTGRLRKAIEYPSLNFPVPRTTFDGSSWPSALSACPGLTPPLGQPIILQLGKGDNSDGVVAPDVHLIVEGGAEVAHCMIDSANYRNDDAKQLQWGRNILYSFGAVVLIPAHPLETGHQYSVLMKVDGTEYSWQFTLAPDAR
ncbi:MAG: hypothetical protein ACLQDV_04480 [Candidatus Binataceae bacterium]